VTARITTEYSKLVLQGYDIKRFCVQEMGGAFVPIEIRFMHLMAHDGWVVVMSALIGHCDDSGVKGRAVRRDSLLQIGGKRRDSTAAREGIADERYTAR
jgi:hypothetical protein